VASVIDISINETLWAATQLICLAKMSNTLCLCSQRPCGDGRMIFTFRDVVNSATLPFLMGCL
jgi:hypothetical protein